MLLSKQPKYPFIAEVTSGGEQAEALEDIFSINVFSITSTRGHFSHEKLLLLQHLFVSIATNMTPSFHGKNFVAVTKLATVHCYRDIKDMEHVSFKTSNCVAIVMESHI